MNSKTQVDINVGIDTSQSQLEIYVRPTGDYFQVENTPEGAIKAASRIQKNRLLRMPKNVQPPIQRIVKAIQKEIAGIDQKLDKLHDLKLAFQCPSGSP